jgi:SulP family sulfate permease
LQTLLSATVADTITGEKHHPNAELLAIGFGNILAGLVAGLPASGAIARTETNIHSGAKTPLAASFHAVLILLYVLLLAPYMSYIPMASLAALLLAVAYRMSHWQQFLRIIQIAPRSDTIVLFACFGFTVFIDMAAGVMVGMVLACFLLFKRIADLTHAEVSHVSTGHHPKMKHYTLPEDVMVYHINGLLFLGAAEKAFDHADLILANVKTLIIDVEDVPLIDMTGLVAIKFMILNVQHEHRTIILCGNREVTGKILQKLPVTAMSGLRTVESLEQAITLIKK